MTTSTSVVIDIGGTHVRLGHLIGTTAHSELTVLDTESLRRGEPLDVLERAIRTYADHHDLSPAAVVLGVPFTPDPEMDTALSSPNIRNLEGLPIGSRLSERLGIPVRLERDINLLLLGEWRAGAAYGYSDVFGMFIGTGIGGCFLQNGTPFRGSTGAALELGHIPIRGEGRICVCGNTDCLEAYACGRVLTDIASAHELAIDRVFIDGQRSKANEALREFTRDLAYALATAINLFQPELAVVGGGIPAMEGFPRDDFERIFYDHLRKPVPAETVEFKWAELGSLAALGGAATLLSRNNPDTPPTRDETVPHSPEGDPT